MSRGKLSIHSTNILPIIKKWLYSDHDVFVRELVSNSCDAISKVKILSDQGKAKASSDEFRIDITVDKDAKTLQFADTGLGMTGDEIEKYIAQIAFSGAEDFVKHIETTDKSQIIGHFGLGFYSAYMVATTVTIDSLSYKEGAEAAFWSCDGTDDYTLEAGKRTSRGTEITLHVGSEHEDYLDVEKIRGILKQYCSFLAFPIYLNGERINETDPLWVKPASECSEQDYKDFFAKLYPMEQEPLFWVHLSVDYPFNLKGILYVCKAGERMDMAQSNIQLYCNRVFVSDNCKDIVPDYLMTLKGVIDSPDIPLNVSRSALQVDRTVKQLGAHISKKVADALSASCKNDREKFISYWPEVEIMVKYGSMNDEKFYERAKSCILFETTKKEWTSLDELFEGRESKKAYYTNRRAIAQDLIKLYEDKNLPVLYTQPFDLSYLAFVERHNSDWKFARIDSGADELIKDEKPEDADSLASVIAKLLDQADVSVEAKSLSQDSVSGFLQMDEGSRRFRDQMAAYKGGMDFDMPTKRTFIINASNPLIRNIQKLEGSKPELAKGLVRHVFDLAKLNQGELKSEDVPAFIARSNEVIAQMASEL